MRRNVAALGWIRRKFSKSRNRVLQICRRNCRPEPFYEGGGAADKGVVTSGGDDDKGLTTLDSGGSEAVVALVLVDSERLTSDGGLVDLEEGILGDDAAISGDNGTLGRLAGRLTLGM